MSTSKSARPCPAQPGNPTAPSTILWATHALLAQGWASDVCVQVDGSGHIESVRAGVPAPPHAVRCGVLLPAPANVHSHSFQRAFAGLTETRSTGGRDSFWTWRELMYRFLRHLDPDDLESIGAYVFMESLEVGYAAIGEFHYLHHQPDGTPYANLAEMSQRLAAAASQTGIGLTLLPVMYQQGGCDGRALNAGQLRFYNDADRFARLHADAVVSVRSVAADCITGVAPHSLRAVSRDGLGFVQTLAPAAPIHLHIAEQTAEVEEVLAARGQRPVEWLLSHQPVDERWCLVHATQTTRQETQDLARCGAVTGLCPVTEANLGDGIFDGVYYLENEGRFGVGTDSNIRLSLVDELRMLEYSQRLRDHSRAALARPDRSTGRMLFETAASGGAQAVGRNAGVITVGKLADLVALDTDSPTLIGLRGDTLLDSYLFAGDDNLVTDVWSAGRHVVTGGRHIHADRITDRFRQTMARLRALL